MPTDLLTLTEAAAVLGLRRWTVWALVSNKTIPGVRRPVVGHARPLWFVKRADVDAYAVKRGDRLGKGGRTKGA